MQEHGLHVQIVIPIQQIIPSSAVQRAMNIIKRSLSLPGILYVVGFDTQADLVCARENFGTHPLRLSTFLETLLLKIPVCARI